PPIVLLGLAMLIPAEVFPRSRVPVTSVPMKLPWIRLNCVVVPENEIPAPPLPEMTFRAPDAVPPMVLLAAKTVIPFCTLPRTAAPPPVVPMRLPKPLPPRPNGRTPLPRLRETRFPAPASVPPMVVLFAETSTPLEEFFRARAPVTSVPMRLPWITLLSVLLPPVSKIPSTSLPEMRVPAPDAVPPMVLLELVMLTPEEKLPRSIVPVTSVPMKFPCTRLPVAEEPEIDTPTPLLAEMMLPAPAVVPPMVLFALVRETPALVLPRPAV